MMHDHDAFMDRDEAAHGEVVDEIAGTRAGLGLGAELTAMLRDDQPRVMRMPFGHEATVLTRFEDVRELHADHRGFSLEHLPASQVESQTDPEGRRRSRKGNLLALDPPAHTRLRGLLTPHFTARRLSALQPRIEELTANLLDDLEVRGRGVDIVAHFAVPLPLMVVGELLGVPEEDRAGFAQRGAAQINARTNVGERARLRETSLAKMRELVAEHRERPGTDLLSGLVAEHGAPGGELDDEELTGLAMLLLDAGHETTSNTIALSVLALLTHPDQLAVLRSSPERTDTAIEELLRYCSVLHAGFPRVTRSTTRIGNHELAAGELVCSSLAAANRDPVLLDDPDQIDLTRDAVPHVAFGHGVHHCLGAPLARIELRTALTALISRFSALRLADPAHDPRFHEHSLTYGVTELPVEW